MTVQFKTVTREYTVPMDVDGDGMDELVTIREEYQVAELDNDENTTTDAELAWAAANGDVMVTFSFEPSGASEPGQVTLTAEGAMFDPRFVPASEGLIEEASFDAEALLGQVELREVRAFEAYAVGVPGAFDDVLIAQSAAAPNSVDVVAWQNLCGPTALLMILARMGVYEGNIDGAAIRELGEKAGTSNAQGTSYTALQRIAEQDYNLRVENLNDGDLRTFDDFFERLFGALEAGQPVLISVGFREFVDESGPATTHYVIVTGYEDGRFSVVDPDSGTERSISWDHLEQGVQGRLNVLGSFQPHYFMLTFS